MGDERTEQAFQAARGRLGGEASPQATLTSRSAVEGSSSDTSPLRAATSPSGSSAADRSLRRPESMLAARGGSDLAHSYEPLSSKPASPLFQPTPWLGGLPNDWESKALTARALLLGVTCRKLDPPPPIPNGQPESLDAQKSGDAQSCERSHLVDPSKVSKDSATIERPMSKGLAEASATEVFAAAASAADNASTTEVFAAAASAAGNASNVPGGMEDSQRGSSRPPWSSSKSKGLRLAERPLHIPVRYTINENIDRPKYCHVMSKRAVPQTLPVVSPRSFDTRYFMRTDEPPKEPSLWYYGKSCGTRTRTARLKLGTG